MQRSKSSKNPKQTLEEENYRKVTWYWLPWTQGKKITESAGGNKRDFAHSRTRIRIIADCNWKIESEVKAVYLKY